VRNQPNFISQIILDRNTTRWSNQASNVLSLDFGGFCDLDLTASNVFMNKELSLKNMDKNKNGGRKIF
jgi:hypothetical protein